MGVHKGYMGAYKVYIRCILAMRSFVIINQGTVDQILRKGRLNETFSFIAAASYLKNEPFS